MTRKHHPQRPLHQRIPIMTVSACLLVILISSLAYLTRDIINDHKHVAERLQAVARVLGMNSTAALSFQDAQVARKVLESIDGDEDILHADIYTAEGRLFAHVTNPTAKAPSRFKHPHALAAGKGQLVVEVPIELDGEMIGTVQLCAVRTPLTKTVTAYLKFVLIVTLALIIIAILVSRAILGHVVRPLESLTDAARRISEGRDYSVRVNIPHKGDATELTAAFNVMLEQIESSEQELKEKGQTLMRHHERLRSLSQSLQNAEERERRGLAAALHDSVCQTLFGLELQLASLEAHSDLPDAVHETVKELRKTVRLSISEARSVTTKLSPRGIYDLGLLSALSSAAADITDEHGLAISIDDRMEGEELHPDMRILAFRCIQELICNTTKHALATRVQVTLERAAQGMRITVEDDGNGFDPDKVLAATQPDCGFGLFSVMERIHFAGGQIEIDSAPGRGTRITMDLPMEPPASPPAPPAA